MFDIQKTGKSFKPPLEATQSQLLRRWILYSFVAWVTILIVAAEMFLI